MAVQSEREKTRQLNRFAGRRSEANNALSFFVQLVDQSPNCEQLWMQVKQDLVRLSASSTQDLRTTSSQQVIEEIKAAESMSLYEVANNFGRDYGNVVQHRKVAAVAFAYILQREGLLTEIPAVVDQEKYGQLGRLHKEADVIGSVIKKEGVADQLQQMPDLKALLESFGRYSTVRIFLEENQVPCTRQQMRLFNSDLRDYLFGSGVQLQLRTLLRKATFSRWLYKKTNWHDRDQDVVDDVVNRCAAFACSAPAPKDEYGGIKVRNLRFFLGKIIAQEFAIAQQDINSGAGYTFDEMFISANGSIAKPDDIDIPETFRFCEDVSYCFQSLRSFVREYIEGTDSLQSRDYFALHAFNDPRYTLEYRRKWISAGLIFLENALFLRSRGELPSWEDLNVDRRESLRRFREIFQNSFTGLFKHKND